MLELTGIPIDSSEQSFKNWLKEKVGNKLAASVEYFTLVEDEDFDND